MSRFRFIISTLSMVVLLGCSQEKKETQLPPVAQSAPVANPVATAPEIAAPPQAVKPKAGVKRSPAAPRRPVAAPRREVTEVREAPAPVPEPIEPAPSRTHPSVVAEPIAAAPIKPAVAVIPSGTRFQVRLVEAITSAEKRPGDKFEATLASDLQADGRLLAPKGSIVVGKLSGVERAGKVEGRARLALILTELQVRGESYGIETNTLTFEAEASTKDDAAKIGAGAGIGAAIGAIAGGGKGAAIGAVIGGGAGTATVLSTRGKEVELAVEQEFTFRLERDVQVKID
jgi:hypothetical protein